MTSNFLLLMGWESDISTIHSTMLVEISTLLVLAMVFLIKEKV